MPRCFSPAVLWVPHCASELGQELLRDTPRRWGFLLRQPEHGTVYPTRLGPFPRTPEPLMVHKRSHKPLSRAGQQCSHGSSGKTLLPPVQRDDAWSKPRGFTHMGCTSGLNGTTASQGLVPRMPGWVRPPRCMHPATGQILEHPMGPAHGAPHCSSGQADRLVWGFLPSRREMVPLPTWMTPVKPLFTFLLWTMQLTPRHRLSVLGPVSTLGPVLFSIFINDTDSWDQVHPRQICG